MKINQKSGGNFAKLEAVEIYTNGSKEGIHSLNNEFIELEAENILSLYIKFERLSDISRTDKFDGEYMRSSFFDKNKSIGITEIQMMHGGNRLNLKAPQILPGSFTASSTLSPNEAYGVQNLMDSHKEFAWVEGAPGLGIGETINVNLDSETEITGILVNNGFQRSESHFKANARVKELKIEDEKAIRTSSSWKIKWTSSTLTSNNL